jgi:hypothetical protein
MKGWRTILINVVTAALAWANTRFDWIDLSGDDQVAMVLTVVNVVNIAMRAVTTTAVGKAA